MNQVDALLLVLLIPFALRGWWRGFCREIFGLAGLVGGAATAAVASGPLADQLSHQLPSAAGRAAAFAAVFVGVVLAANLLGIAAERLVRALLLGGVNRFAGLAFGVAKGAALAGFTLLLAERVVPASGLTQLIERSTLGRPLVHVAARVLHAGSTAGAPARTC